MKNRATGLLKQIITMLTAMAKAKTLALKSKTRALKTRLVIFSLLHQNRKILVSSISHKLNALMAHNEKKFKQDEDDDANNARGDDYGSNSVMLYNRSAPMSPLVEQTEKELIEEDRSGEEKYQDLTQSTFDSESELEEPVGSVIDLVKNSKEDKGEEFRLEDEIDRVADLFIRRFHRQMRLQKQLSFKNYHDMLERSA